MSEYWDRWLATVSGEKTRLDVPFIKELLQRNITNILDVGSGRGQRIKKLAQLGFRITCVDSSLQAAYYIQKVAQHPSINLNIICADMRELPFRDSTFGAAISYNVLNFFVDESEREKAIKEVQRVVTPGGVVLFFVISVEDEGAQKGIDLGNQNVQLPDGMCLHYFTCHEVESVLKSVTIHEITQFTKKDTTHDTPHIHAFIRVLAFLD